MKKNLEQKIQLNDKNDLGIEKFGTFKFMRN
jgi:hypothetical protein